MSTEKPGMMDQMGGAFEKIASYPDTCEVPKFLEGKISTATWRKVMRVVFDILVITLGVILLYTMRSADPGIMSMMSMPMMIAVGGVGLAWLIEDAIGKENHRTAAKVMAVLLPMVMFTGIVCMMGASFQPAMYVRSFGSYYMVGVILLPFSVLSIGHTLSVLTDDRGQFIHRRAPREYLPHHEGLIPQLADKTDSDVELTSFTSSDDESVSD